MNIPKVIRIPLFFLVSILLLGVIGYRIIEGWGLLDSLYMTLITITTVGFGEVYPLSRAGRVFTMVLIIGGISGVGYTFGTISRILLEGELTKILGRKKLEKDIQNLKGHYIVCGFGQVGKVICDELAKKSYSFVVIERDSELVPLLEEKGFLFVHGDCATEEVLSRAGTERAKGLVAAVSSDADNLYAVLTAREMNPNLFILARSNSERAERKLMWAKADKVISPHYIGGLRMSQAILRPNVLDFIDITTQSQSMELQMEEIEVKNISMVNGSMFSNCCGVTQNFGLIIVAIKKPSGIMLFNPSGEHSLEVGDILIVLGEKDNLNKLDKLTG